MKEIAIDFLLYWKKYVIVGKQFFYSQIEFYKSFPNVEKPSNFILIGVNNAKLANRDSRSGRGQEVRKLRYLKKIYLSDLKYVHRLTRKQAEQFAHEESQEESEDDAGSDSCITSDMSDTDNEASKEYFN